MSVGKKITLEQARKLAANYTNSKLGNVLPKNDTMSTWFSADVVAAALGIELPANHPVSGIRFYFGAYDASMLSKDQLALDNRLTLVMVSTQDSDGKQVNMLGADGTDAQVYNESQLCPPLCSEDETKL